MKTNNTLNFLILTLLSLLLGIFSKHLLNIDELISNTLAEQLTHEQLEKVLNIKESMEWVVYFTIPLILLIKISIISAIIDATCFFFDKKIEYRKIFNLVIKSEYIFIIAIIFKTIWFYFFNTDYSLEDVQNFYPLSALNITGYEDLSPWFIHPFQIINLFELAYFFLLAYLIGKELKISLDKGLKIVVSGYGASLVIWIVCVMFFTLNFS